MFDNGLQESVSNNFTENKGPTEPAVGFRSEINYLGKFKYCNVIENVATQKRTICFTNCSMNIENSNFISNIAPLEGVIFAEAENDLKCNNLIFEDNSCDFCFYSYSNAKFYLYNISFANNSGSKYNEGNFDISNFNEISMKTFAIKANCQKYTYEEETEFIFYLNSFMLCVNVLVPMTIMNDIFM